VQAHPRRVARVSKQIQKEVSTLLVTDKVLLDVIRNYDGGGALCDCSGIQVSNDLQVVKIYLTMMTDDPVEKDRILQRMKGLTGCAWLTGAYRADLRARRLLDVRRRCSHPDQSSLIHVHVITIHGSKFTCSAG
jgi:ribosome-binding factor A